MTESKPHLRQSALVMTTGKARRPRTTTTVGLFSIVGLAALLILGGCATVLEPMTKPQKAVGDTEVWRSRTGVLTHTLVAMDNTTMSYEIAENGCSYTRPKGGLLPWTRWSNCRGMPDGTQTVIVIEGRIWPLEIGRTWRYRKAGSDRNGNEWSETASCKVYNQRRLRIASGDHYVFRTICRTKTERDVIYVAPAIGRNVLTWHSRLDRSQLPIRRELARFTAGAAK